MLTTYGINEFFDGSQVVPNIYLYGSNSSTPKYIAWKRNNETTCSWIYRSITSEVSRYLYGKKYAHNLWKKYEEAFVHSTQSKIMKLTLQIQTVKKEAQSIDYVYQNLK